MSTRLPTRPELLQLPSDQDSTGRTLGAEELAMLARAVESGTLTSTKGDFVKTFEERFAAAVGARHAVACSSGSAAVHAAVAALDSEPGDEIITTPITDMGALAPILYQGAIPVFADVDPATCNVTAATVEARISSRTRAVVVTHLFGNPCEMREIMELARSRGLVVIEDCAQAFLAEHRGERVGTVGDIGCFSLQQGKHITTGEGGVVTANDEQLARRLFLFVNKAWGYGDPEPDHYFLALNYRMNELTGAVALAQLDKLDFSVTSRVRAAELLTRLLRDLRPSIKTPRVAPHNRHTYWKYCLRVDPSRVRGGAVGMARVLKERGIASAPRYIQKPAFACAVFREQRTFGRSRFPFTLARPEAVDYDPARFPGAYHALEQILVLPWNEHYTADHVHHIADAVHEAHEQLAV